MATLSPNDVGTLDADVAEYLRAERRRQAVVTAIGGAVLLLLGIVVTLIAGYVRAELARRGDMLAAGLALNILGAAMIRQSLGFRREVESSELATARVVQNDQPSVA